MEVVHGHSKYRIREHGNPRAFAFMSLGGYGVTFSFKGLDIVHQDHLTFAISPEDCRDIADIAPTLARAIPLAKRDRERTSSIERHLMPEFPPIVDRIIANDGEDHSWRLEGHRYEEQDIVVGGLKWARDYLVMRVEEVDAIIFDAEPFNQFADIAGNKPTLPPKRSIWDTV